MISIQYTKFIMLSIHKLPNIKFKKLNDLMHLDYHMVIVKLGK